MPVTTTEVPTFFGPSDSPLFGVLHLPADRTIRGGVLICSSLGREGVDSVRLHRILADDLARRGFAALHFHYLGLGNSAYAQGRDDAVANMVASVGHALDYLTLIGSESITAIGVRAGCLILDEHLAQAHSARPVKRVVYLDPPGSGRRYLREHTTLFRLSVGEDAITPGQVAVVGGRLSKQAAAEFSALRLNADPLGAHGVEKAFLVGRAAETDKQLTALASAEGVDSIVTGGLSECAHPLPIPLPIPFDAVESITQWIDENAGAHTHPAVPEYRTSVAMPAHGPGADVVESIERIEPNGLFVIRTQPRRSSPAKTVLFFTEGHESHVGPTREWVELSRRIAAAGSQALRWDPAHEGLSGEIRRDPWRRVYTKAEVADATAVARHACQDAGQLELVGICSGSWYAAHVARNIGARSATLINPMVWSWRVAPTLLEQWYFQKQTLQTAAPGDTSSGSSETARTRRLEAFIRRSQQRTKILMHRHLPRSVLRLLSWVGLVFLPEDVLATLANRGTDVTLVVSSEDAEQFTLRGGRSAVGRLQRASQPPRVIDVPDGDHAANHPAMLAAIRDAVLPVACSPDQGFATNVGSAPNALLANRTRVAMGSGTASTITAAEVSRG
jgi:hypothetical protein